MKVKRIEFNYEREKRLFGLDYDVSVLRWTSIVIVNA